MCCAFLTLTILGPRFFGVIWWIISPLRWETSFREIASGDLWWIWAVLGIVFLPWTTIMYVIVAPGGIHNWDWLWLGLMLVADIASYAGGAGRKRIPGYEGS
jgi:hypothetical protein